MVNMEAFFVDDEGNLSGELMGIPCATRSAAHATRI
jgi:hypothetical protein